MKEMSAAGVNCGLTGLEAPNQMGKTERHGGMWKDVAEKVATDKRRTTPREMMLLAAETSSVMNEMNRVGGFSPAQWVIGRQPRHAGEIGDDETRHDLNSMAERIDPTTKFGLRMQIRHEAKKTYVHLDFGRRVQSALTRKAVATKGEFRVGGLVTYQRNHDKDGAKQHEQWKR